MQKALSDKKLFKDIIKYVHKIITANAELEALPNEFLSDWQQRKRVKDQRNQLQFDIIYAQGMLRRKIDRMMIEE